MTFFSINRTDIVRFIYNSLTVHSIAHQFTNQLTQNWNARTK